jgi:hypothetical protein
MNTVLKIGNVFFQDNKKISKGKNPDNSSLPVSDLKWILKDHDKNISISAYRTGKYITLSGIFKNKIYNKKYKIDTHPWYQDWPSGIKNLIYSGKNSLIFWSIDPETLKIARFKAVIKKQGNVNIHNKKFLYVNIFLTGLQRLFWKGILLPVSCNQ